MLVWLSLADGTLSYRPTLFSCMHALVDTELHKLPRIAVHSLQALQSSVRHAGTCAKSSGHGPWFHMAACVHAPQAMVHPYFPYCRVDVKASLTLFTPTVDAMLSECLAAEHPACMPTARPCCRPLTPCGSLSRHFPVIFQACGSFSKHFPGIFQNCLPSSCAVHCNCCHQTNQPAGNTPPCAQLGESSKWGLTTSAYLFWVW